MLTRAAAPAGVAAFGGTVAWSEFDAGSSRYRLVIYRHGRASRPAIAGREVPFDVSVGPDAAGAPVVAYTRCRTESEFVDVPEDEETSPARGCQIDLLSPATGRETVVQGIGGPQIGLLDPVVWGGRIAWIQGNLPGAAPDEVLVRAISPGAAAVAVNLIPKQSCYTLIDDRGAHEHCLSVRPAGYAHIALRAARLAAAVEGAPVGCGFGTGFITLARADGSVQTVDTLCQGMSGQDYEGPVFDGRWLYFHLRCTEDPGGCEHPDVYRVPVGAARGTRADDGLGANVLGFALSGGREYAIAGSGICDESGTAAVDRCPLVEIRNLHFG